MKFFYALMLYLISMMLFALLYAVIIPTPKLYLSETLSQQFDADTNNIILQKAVEISKFNNKENYYAFDESVGSKKAGAIFLYTLLTGAFLIIITLLFFNRAYISFPLYLAVISIFIVYSILWLFTNSISQNLYLDIQSIRQSYNGFRSPLVILPSLFLLTTITLFGYFYKFPK